MLSNQGKPREQYIVRDEKGYTKRLVVVSKWVGELCKFTYAIRIEDVRPSLSNGEEV